MNVAPHIIRNVAEWHAEQASVCYRLGHYDAYARHVQIADAMRASLNRQMKEAA